MLYQLTRIEPGASPVSLGQFATVDDAHQAAQQDAEAQAQRLSRDFSATGFGQGTPARWTYWTTGQPSLRYTITAIPDV